MMPVQAVPAMDGIEQGQGSIAAPTGPPPRAPNAFDRFTRDMGYTSPDGKRHLWPELSTLIAARGGGDGEGGWLNGLTLLRAMSDAEIIPILAKLRADRLKRLSMAAPMRLGVDGNPVPAEHRDGQMVLVNEAEAEHSMLRCVPEEVGQEGAELAPRGDEEAEPRDPKRRKTVQERVEKINTKRPALLPKPQEVNSDTDDLVFKKSTANDLSRVSKILEVLTKVVDKDSAAVAALFQQNDVQSYQLHQVHEQFVSMTAQLASNGEQLAAIAAQQLKQDEQIEQHLALHRGFGTAVRPNRSIGGANASAGGSAEGTHSGLPLVAAPVAVATAMETGDDEAVLPMEPRYCLNEEPSWVLPEGFKLFNSGSEWMVQRLAPGPGAMIRPYEDWKDVWFGTSAELATHQVKMNAPAHFTGEGECNPELSLMGLENFFRSTGVPQGMWGRQVQNLLKGPALQAYSAFALPLYEANRIPSWDQVRSMVLSFKKSDTPTVARSKLASIKQTSSVQAFNNLFRHLLSQIGDDPPAFTDQKGFYIKGLTNPALMHPSGKQWLSIEEMMGFHLERELEELKLQPASDRYKGYKPPFRGSNSRPPRLNVLQGQKRPGEAKAPGGDRSRHRQSAPPAQQVTFAPRPAPPAQQGTSAPRPAPRSQVLPPRDDLFMFGHTNPEFLSRCNDSCPLRGHGKGHNKGQCYYWIKEKERRNL